MADMRGTRRHQGFSGNKGVTLIEIMIALVVLLVVYMGLIQAALLSIDHNLRNKVRDESVRIAAETMTAVKSRGFNNLTDNSTSSYPYPGIAPDPPGVVWSTPTRNFGNFPQQFTVGLLVQDLDSNNKQVTVRVHYTYRAEQPPVTYTINSVMVGS